ncbi:MAG TPA: 4Fe-4S single cluster domain-containing protein [Allosphingosinicella sp.]
MIIGINRIQRGIITLGPGRRIAIWVQGCSIGCLGCMSRNTWDAGGEPMEIGALLAWCSERIDTVDGVTISGGEPFEQPEALAALLDGLRALRQETGREIDLLCYSGLPWKRLKRDFPEILARLDAVIPEPFAESQPTHAAWRGSANQPVRILSPLGERRFSADALAKAAASRAMQVSVEDGQVWLTGVPRRGDLDAIAEAAAAQGIALEGMSWRS